MSGKIYDTSQGFYRSSYTDGDCCCKRLVTTRNLIRNFKMKLIVE